MENNKMLSLIEEIEEHFRAGFSEDESFVLGARSANCPLTQLTEKELEFLIHHFNYKNVNQLKRRIGDEARS